MDLIYVDKCFFKEELLLSLSQIKLQRKFLLLPGSESFILAIQSIYQI